MFVWVDQKWNAKEIKKCMSKSNIKEKKENQSENRKKLGSLYIWVPIYRVVEHVW